jgi:hypothetical protein
MRVAISESAVGEATTVLQQIPAGILPRFVQAAIQSPVGKSRFGKPPYLDAALTFLLRHRYNPKN